MPDHRRKVASPDDLTPSDLEHAVLSTARRGFAQDEVRELLATAAAALAAARQRVAELERALAQAEDARASGVGVGEDDLIAALGEETAAVLRSAREAAADLRAKADETATRVVGEAQEEAERLRSAADSVLEERTREAEAAAAELLAAAEARAEEITAAAERRAEAERQHADAAAEEQVEGARLEAQELIDAARAERTEIVDDLARRRALLLAQIEELRRGRDGLIDAYRVVKRTFLDATGALARVEQQAAAGALVSRDDDAARLPEADRYEQAATPGDTGAPEHDTGEAVEPMIAAHEAASSGPPPTMDDVDSLFARLRASQEEAPPPAPQASAGDETDEADDTQRPAEPDAEPAPNGSGDGEIRLAEEEQAVDADVVYRRDEAVAETAAALGRMVKREVQDEQNGLLDAVRRHKKGVPEPDQVMEPAEAHLARWSAVVRPSVDEAYAAGRRLVGGDPEPLPDDVVRDLTVRLVAPLRERTYAAIADGRDDDFTEVLDRIGARYREWKAQELDAGVRALLVDAFARGSYDAAPEGDLLVWVTPADGCSADCHDNALEPTTRGESFPTGQVRPPAYAGCRCIAVPHSMIHGGVSAASR
jgi:cell division septum initiation protein DivIVA